MRTIVAIIAGLAAATAVYWYQNPDLELEVPRGLLVQIEERRSALRQVPESFAELVATATLAPDRKSTPSTKTDEPAGTTIASTPKPVRGKVNATTNPKPVRSTAIVQEEPKADSHPQVVTDPVDRVAELEQKVHTGINAARSDHGGLAQLQWVDPLGEVARAHSNDMTDRGYFSHDTPEGIDPFERIERSGYSCWDAGARGMAENLTIVLADKSLDRMASKAVESWVNSPGHSGNLLSSDYVRTGVGASFGRWRGYNAVYLTQVFC